MKYAIPYGKGFVDFQIDEPLDVLIPSKAPKVADASLAVREAIHNPIGSADLATLARGKHRVVIVINDITRPSPTKLLVEEIDRKLKSAGVIDSDITILVATGNHRANTEQELIGMLGEELYRRFNVKNHNASDPAELAYVGRTMRGLEIVVNRLVVESDLTITTGIITPHQSAGFSGGRKSIVPGVAGVRSVEQHHSFPIRPDHPVMGTLENNSFHDEAVEAALTVGVDFIVNVVRNSDGEIVSVVAGDLVKAHEQGVRECMKVWGVSVSGRYDITITSPGGYPKDFDMHQAQKALATAEMITKPGGTIILVAECPDGIGKFANLLMDSRDPQEVIDTFKREGFNSTNHSSKAFMYARALQRYNIFFVTDKIDHLDLKKMFFNPSVTVERAYKGARMKCADSARVALLPYAVDCIIKAM